MLFGEAEDLLPHRCPLGILLLGLDAFDAGLHCREFSIRHILEFLRTCHVFYLRREWNPLQILNASVYKALQQFIFRKRSSICWRAGMASSLVLTLALDHFLHSIA